MVAKSLNFQLEPLPKRMRGVSVADLRLFSYYAEQILRIRSTVYQFSYG